MLQIESFVFNPFQVNTYLVRDEEGNCLVMDPAFYTPDEIRAFDRYISSEGLKVTGQLNTHCHVDHVLGVKHMKTVYQCPVRAHQNESSLLSNAPFQGELFGLQLEPVPGIDHPIEDHDIIAVGEDSLRSILVPGHSPGSLCFYDPAGGFVITGDALFRGSIGRTDLPGGDYDTLIRSIRSRLLALPPETRVYPGHGEPTSIGEEAATNPFLSMP
jgi:glyoxylase-like metal-dependent hydrolase (beta-lactamase superfamily II)